MLCAVILALLLAAAAADSISGTWEGTSLCQVKPSACHDEHVVYRFSLSGPKQYKLDAYKLDAGKEEFMGSMNLTLAPKQDQLDGTIQSPGRLQGRLLLRVRGDHLSGRMSLMDGTLYRLIEVAKR
jgi:hypothetical protein